MQVYNIAGPVWCAERECVLLLGVEPYHNIGLDIAAYKPVIEIE